MNVLTNLKLIAALVAGCLITYSCGKDKEKPEVTLKQYQVPVLKYRQNNPVLQIKINLAADAPARKVTSFIINTDGTDNLTDIKNG